MPTKPSTSPAQQVTLIKSKGFIVNDESKCEQYFDRNNYYRASAYLLPFRKSDGTYVQNIPFQRIQNIDTFDSKMRNLLTGAIEQIEFYCRTQFSRSFVNSHGPLGYMDAANYASAHDHTGFLAYISKFIQENKRSPVVIHHQTKYGGDFPLWVIIELFSIGTLSRFYSDMLTPDQKAIAAKFKTSVPCMKSWMRCVTDLRNRCAHYSRLYYWAFPAVPRMPSNATFFGDHTLFSQVLMLKFLYPDGDEWNDGVLKSLKELIQAYSSDIELAHIGFPTDWETRLTR